MGRKATRFQNLKRHWDFLHVLARSLPRQRQNLIKGASTEQIDTLCETCYNVLKGVVPLTRYYKRRLRDYRSDLKAIACSKNSTRDRHALLLKQKGGNLFTILGPILLKKLLPEAAKALGVHVLAKAGTKLSSRLFKTSSPNHDERH